MSRRRVANPLALAVLGCLSERPMHPYEISTTLRHRGKDESIKINYGSLYSVVDSLVKHKLIAAQETVRDGKRPERTVYAITQSGVEEFEDWLSELLEMPSKEFTSLEAGLSLLPGLPPDEVARLLEQRSARLDRQLAAMAASRKQAEAMQLPELFLVEWNFRFAMTQAELQFVRRLADDIRSGALGGTSVWRRIYELRAEGMSTEEIFADAVGHLGEEARVLAPNPKHRPSATN